VPAPHLSVLAIVRVMVDKGELESVFIIKVVEKALLFAIHLEQIAHAKQNFTGHT
jgi:hypothetical protein